MNTKPTAQYVREVLSYDQHSGEFTWRERPVEMFLSAIDAKKFNNRFAMQKAGWKTAAGRTKIQFDHTSYFASVLAWLYMTGEWPDSEIDHADCDNDNDSWVNLRLATRAQNSANRKKSSNNKSGLKGVVHRTERSWVAKISKKYLGTFDCPAAASLAYQVAADNLYGAYARPL